jgi:hypothetical protein
MNRTHQTLIKKTMVQVKFLTTAEIDELRNRYKRKVVNGQTRTSAIQPKERKAFKYGITSETSYYRA